MNTKTETNAARLDARGRIIQTEAPQDTARRSVVGRERLTIAVDFDGVLFDHVPYLLRGFRDAHGIDLEDEGLRYWDFFQYRAVREKNLTWQCVRTVLQAIDTDEAIHQLPPRDPQARAVMKGWAEEGHEVFVVTAREETARKSTETFLAHNQIPHDGLVMGASRKTGYDVLVDDAPHNVLMAAADGGLALLMDHPYNRDVPTKRNPLRVRSWRDVELAVAANRRVAA
ncbi:MAG: hypothetical protein WDA16_08075 [Candidatus Thermoplasmatota archaeon]